MYPILEIDYNVIDPKYRNTVKVIEDKPHVRYIRYLMTKRYSPRIIKQELHRMALSAPHEPNLTAYYLSVIDPVIKAFGLSDLYSDYKGKLLRKNQRCSFSQDLLNYRIHLGEELDLQPKFHKFVNFIEINDVWSQEIIKFHGVVARLPVDENGERILHGSHNRDTIDRVLLHPKRYMIDKMILENIGTQRIIKHFRDNYSSNFIASEIDQYRKIFFYVKTSSIEDRIKSIEVERNSLLQFYKDIDKDSSEDMGIGEKMAVKRQSEQRVQELDESLKILTAMYSESAHKSAVSERDDILGMFSDVMVRGYSRFCSLDNYKDRDVVDPLVKVAKMMAFSYDKVREIEVAAESGKGGDAHSSGVIMEIYQKRMEDLAKEEMERVNEAIVRTGGKYAIENVGDPNEIGGIEDLGVNFDPDDFSED